MGSGYGQSRVTGARSHVCTVLSTLSFHRASVLHKKAISAVHSLLCSHDVDPRYTETTVKAKVAELYLPLLSLARDTLPRLHGFAGQRAGEDGFHGLWGGRVRDGGRLIRLMSLRVSSTGPGSPPGK